MTLPLAVRVAQQAVCCQVHYDYITGVQGPRQAWMAEKEAEKRVMLIGGQQLDLASNVSFGWLCIEQQSEGSTAVRCWQPVSRV